jgi:hypothetical protein
MSNHMASKIRVVDSHTGGEPTRVVVSGGPDLGEGPLAERVDLVDAHAIDCLLPDAAASIGDIVARLVREGVTVTSAGLHPSWTEQLLEETG